MNIPDYRSSHTTAGSGHRYDLLFDSDRYDGWIWSREQNVLKTVIEEYLARDDFRLLDFACGTGRILAFLESFAREAVGVDVSAEMLRLAEERVRRARLLRVDLTSDGPLEGGKFDVVTAFRFFLNADGPLRVEALAALREALRDGGLLLANIHGNLWSLRLPSYLFRRWVLGQNINAVSPRFMTRLLRDSGFDVVRVFGVGWCTRRLFGLVGKRWANRIEDLMERVPLLAWFATDLIFLCAQMGQEHDGSRR